MNAALRFPVIAFLAIGLSGCGISEKNATARAVVYGVDDNAPIKAQNSIVISAPPQKVWVILTGIDRWSSWRPEVSASHLNAALTPGTPFTWTVGGTSISSQIAAVDNQRRIAWTGHAMGLTAIHIWVLQPLAPNRTLVRTTETMTGFPSSLFYSSADLQSANGKWLSDLKRLSERANTADSGQK